MKNLISKLRHEITCWEEGLTYEEEALFAIHELVTNRLIALGCPINEEYTKAALIEARGRIK